MSLKRALAIVTGLVTLALATGVRAQAPGIVALTPGETKFDTVGLAMAGMSHKLAPHSHPDAREITILSGTWLTGYGEKFDAAALKTLPAGSVYTEPANRTSPPTCRSGERGRPPTGSRTRDRTCGSTCGGGRVPRQNRLGRGATVPCRPG